MWTLIVMSFFHYSSNISVTPVYGFTSQDACHKAGVRIADASPTKNEVTFTCVSKAAEQ